MKTIWNFLIRYLKYSLRQIKQILKCEFQTWIIWWKRQNFERMETRIKKSFYGKSQGKASIKVYLVDIVGEPAEVLYEFWSHKPTFISYLQT